MSTTGMLTARQWAQIMGLGLLLALTIVAVLAVVLPTAALVIALALLAAGATFVAQRAGAVAQAARAAVNGGPRPAAEPQPTLRLTLADGSELSARPVPLAGESEHALLLTRDGYMVVSAEGRVIHTIR